MKNSKYNRAKKKLNEWKINAFVDALFPFGRSIPDVVGPFKLICDAVIILGGLSLLVSFQPWVIFGMSFSAIISLSFFTATLMDNFSCPDYKRLKMECVGLKLSAERSNDNVELSISKSKSISETSKNSMHSVKNDKCAYSNNCVDNEVFSKASPKNKVLIKRR